MIIAKLKCPKCDCDNFRILLNHLPNFFWDGDPMTYEVIECSSCGWRGNPTEEREVREWLRLTLGGSLKHPLVQKDRAKVEEIKR